MLDTLTIEEGGKVTIPDKVRARYGFEPNTPVRMIETHSGILLVPLTDAPMSETLKAELSEWQSLAAESLEMFPYEKGE
jgi:bifunctional DNA-binding transcriptional regulator/antitoxin component of YhaV-PrlF toxin-antitoxin module